MENATEPLDEAIETLIVVNPNHISENDSQAITLAVVGRDDAVRQLLERFNYHFSQRFPVYPSCLRPTYTAIFEEPTDQLITCITELSELPHTKIVQSTNASLVKSLNKLRYNLFINDSTRQQKILDAFNKHAPKEVVEELKRKQEERKRLEETNK